MMRAISLFLVVALCVGVLPAAAAGTARANPDDVAAVWKSFAGGSGAENPREKRTPGGFFEFMGTVSDAQFDPGPRAKSMAVEDVAEGFMLTHKGAFSMPSANIAYETIKTTAAGTRKYVKMGQTYAGLPVFGAMSIVQFNEKKGVSCVVADVMRDTRKLDDGTIPLAPTIDPAEAKQAAIDFLKEESGASHCIATEPELVIYAPSVVGAIGLTQLAWELEVEAQDAVAARKVLINAHSGAVAFEYSLIYNAKNRQIYDAARRETYGTVVRAEGDPATGIADVDTLYDYCGDVYDFYKNQHNRDSIDDAGMAIRATARFCTQYSCPYYNAFWSPLDGRVAFGEGMGSDDVVAHELTHGVTSYSSDLIYANESGALNEAMSDIWGEFVDLTNGAGTDTPEVRWLMGEDCSRGTLRDIQDPPQFSNWFGGTRYPMPDQYQGNGWYYGSADNGGVHHNMSVATKLAYLLTDGDDFGGYITFGMGIERVAQLYYEAQVNLLPRGADYPLFGDLLLQAASNIGMSPTEQQNVGAGLLATRILQLTGKPLRDFRAMPVLNTTAAVLTWKAPTYTGIDTSVNIVRKTGSFPESGSDGTQVQTGLNAESYVDTGVQQGVEYFYRLSPVSPQAGPALYARVVVGEETPVHLAEAFVNGTDLSYSQITMRPLVNLTAAANSGRPEDYVGMGDYVATITQGADVVTSLPVSDDAVIPIPMWDDSIVQFNLGQPFMFFGDYWEDLTLCANGFITGSSLAAFKQTAEGYNTTLLPATLQNHYENLRISPLFADLNPAAGGEIWAGSLDDRVVVTFDSVPEYGSDLPNTFQCELFTNGTIRFTYLKLSVEQAVVGISDGRGVPLRPTDIISGARAAGILTTDLSALPAQAPFALNPIPNYAVKEGSTLTFQVSASSTVLPVSFALDELDPDLASANFERVDDTTYSFTWTPGSNSQSSYTFLVRASAGAYTASQYVTIYITDVIAPPTASNLTLTPTEPGVNQELVADYDFDHQDNLPQAGTRLYWFKNNQMMRGYSGSVVPAEATQVGDRWRFTVQPGVYAGTIFDARDKDQGEPPDPLSIYVYGDIALSPVVTIGQAVKSDVNRDGRVDALDIQRVVNGALGIQLDKTADIDGDGRVTAVDVQHILNATLGGGE